MSGLSDQELSELVRAADPEPPSEAQVAATRQALLTLAAQTPQARPRARGRWLPMAAVAAAVVLLAAAGLWRVWPEGSAVPRRALVTASGQATFEHGAREGLGEVVKLSDGAIRVEVPALPEARPLRIQAGEAEVVVQAGLLEAVVQGGALTRVTVLTGRAEVLRPREPSLSLGEGETWARQRPTPEPAATALAAPPPPPHRAPPPRVRRGPPPPPPAASPPGEPATEAAFRRGWDALEAERWTEAAEAFRAADTPGSAVAEEAGYWRGVALMRSGARGPAIRAFEAFLARHPRSARADEGALVLGHLLREAGRGAEARPWLERAARSPRTEVRDKAQVILQQLR